MALSTISAKTKITASAINNIINAVNAITFPESYVTTTYKSGTSWYRVWSNGFIEQGGEKQGSSNLTPATLTFNKAFPSYCCSLTCMPQGDTVNSNVHSVKYIAITTTYANILTTWASSDSAGYTPCKFRWYACRILILLIIHTISERENCSL